MSKRNRLHPALIPAGIGPRRATISRVVLAVCLVAMMLSVIPTTVMARNRPAIRYEQDDAALQLTGSWITYDYIHASAGSGAYVDEPASAEVHFRGTELDWVTVMGPHYGIAEVSLDGGPPERVDLYSATFDHQQRVWTSGTLRNGYHTVRIEWTGDADPAAIASRISMDAFDIVGQVLPSARRFPSTGRS